MATEIHPTAIVEPGAQLGTDVSIGPYCTIGGQAVIGDRVRLISHVTVAGSTTLGEEVTAYPFSSFGFPPQDRKYQGGDTTVIIGPRSIFREQSTVHLGTEVGRGETRVGSDGYFMVSSHIGHDCVIGDHVTFANGAAVGGLVTIEEHVIMGGLSAVHQHCRIGRHAFVGGGAPLTGDVIPYGMVDNHGALAGLNLVGLKRRGFTRDAINDLRTAYRLFFAAEGAFQERVDDAARLFAHRPEVAEMVDFIRADAVRPLCLPNAR